MTTEFSPIQHLGAERDGTLLQIGVTSIEQPGQVLSLEKKGIMERFRNASLVQIASLFDSLMGDILSKDPYIPTYQLYKLISEQISEKVPHESMFLARKAALSDNENERTLGQQAFILLNLKTIVSTVDLLRTYETDEELSDMTQWGLSGVLESIPMVDPQTSISMQVHRFSKEAIIEYIAKRDQIPYNKLVKLTWQILENTVLQKRERLLDDIYLNQLKAALNEAMEALNKQEREVVMHRYLDERRRVELPANSNTESIISQAFEKLRWRSYQLYKREKKAYCSFDNIEKGVI